jgi:hypothetical protein
MLHGLGWDTPNQTKWVNKTMQNRVFICKLNILRFYKVSAWYGVQSLQLSSCVASRYTRYAGTLYHILDLLIMKYPIVGLVAILPFWKWAYNYNQRAKWIFYTGIYFWEIMVLERGPLSHLRIIEELLEWKNNGSGYRKPRLTAVGIRCGDHATPSIRKSWH